jgi:hypothetical protein
MLDIWTVYDHPTDYPNNYVARRFTIDASGGARPTDSIIVAPDLARLRAYLAGTLFLARLDRQPLDKPDIVETWF